MGSLTGRASSTVEIAPDVEWLDRILGRAAVDPAYRELLLDQPSAALAGEPLPVGLIVALGEIRADDLFGYARLAVATESAYRALLRAARLEEILEVREPGAVEPIGAAA
jgi:hypothetical protein